MIIGLKGSGTVSTRSLKSFLKTMIWFNSFFSILVQIYYLVLFDCSITFLRKCSSHFCWLSKPPKDGTLHLLYILINIGMNQDKIEPFFEENLLWFKAYLPSAYWSLYRVLCVATKTFWLKCYFISKNS